MPWKKSTQVPSRRIVFRLSGTLCKSQPSPPPSASGPLRANERRGPHGARCGSTAMVVADGCAFGRSQLSRWGSKDAADQCGRFLKP